MSIFNKHSMFKEVHNKKCDTWQNQILTMSQPSGVHKSKTGHPIGISRMALVFRAILAKLWGSAVCGLLCYAVVLIQKEAAMYVMESANY